MLDGAGEAMTSASALDHGIRALGWDAAVCGPGGPAASPASPLGPGSMAALDAAHTVLALGCEAVLVARMSSAGERSPDRPISRQTLTVLDLLLEPVTVGIPAGMR